MITENVSLKPFNTLKFDAKARYFTEIKTLSDLNSALSFCAAQELPFWCIGGGSNIVITGDLNGLVLHIALRGIEVLDEGDSSLVIASAGEQWDELVVYCLEQALYGLENLSLIPGSVGAAPIQNIGAYGAEVGEYIEWVEIWDIESQSLRKLLAKECFFSYRDSIFKGRLKNKAIITRVAFRLQKSFQVKLTYDALSDALQAGSGIIDAQRVRDEVCRMRRSKLPDPSITPNVGSFFKNPMINELEYQRLIQQYPQAPVHNQAAGIKKVAAAWLIEQSGWKGRDIGQVGVHSRQALVLVNRGEGSGVNLLRLAREIQRSVKDRFEINLEIEPQIFPSEFIAS